jgi:hypothetical protein
MGVALWVPESVLWLLKTGKNQRARIIVDCKIIKLNKLPELDADWPELDNEFVPITKETEMGLDHTTKVSDELIEVEAEVDDGVKPISYFLKQREVLVNLILMCYMWTTISFCYSLVGF